MGNPLNSVLKYIDPIGNAAGNAISGPKGILTPKQAAPPPAYNPANNPGQKLFTPPAGGLPGAPPGGAPSGGGLFGGGGPQPGYAPNAFQSAGNRSAPPGTGGSPTPGGGWNAQGPLPGGTPPGGAPPGPPPMATGGQNPALQQQMMQAQMLRNSPQMRVQ